MQTLSLQDAIVLARRLHADGQSQRAAQICNAILTRDPSQFDCLSIMGVISLQSGDMGMAAAYLQRAAGLRTDDAQLQTNLAAALQSLGKTDEAIAACRKALAIAPNTLGAYQNL
ncbi:MAG TPA: tetratricopeptide repeat protein, partial [Tepidisphaeraceae bacterium]|nr:tetratricopeptide repeat protein [Tepidisphaeraceae bacterium]